MWAGILLLGLMGMETFISATMTQLTEISSMLLTTLEIGSGYILTDNALNGILSPKLVQEERHYDPERHHV